MKNNARESTRRLHFAAFQGDTVITDSIDLQQVKEVRVLLVERNFDDFGLLLSCVLESDTTSAFTLSHESTLEACLRHLHENVVDVILLDPYLPDSNSLNAISVIRYSAPSAPVILLTSSNEDSLVLSALEAGAQDVLVKGQANMSSMLRTIRHSIARHQANEGLEYLSAVINSCTDAIISAHPDGVIKTWSRGAEEMFGYTAEDMVGKSVGIIYPIGCESEFRGISQQIMSGGAVTNRVTKRRRKNGEVVEVSTSIWPVRRSNGTQIGAVSITRDISEQRKAEREVWELKQRLNLGLDAGEVGVWDLDGATGIIWCSPVCRKIVDLCGVDGYTTVDGLLSRLFDGDRDSVKRSIQKAIDENGEFRIECRVTNAGGEDQWIELFAKKVSSVVNFDQSDRLSGTLIDITERRQREEEKRILELSKEREDFVRALAHDMKNPLIGISRVLEIVQSGKVGELPPQARDLLACMNESNTRVLRLISNLLDVHKWQSVGESYDFSDVELFDVLKNCASQATVMASLKGSSFAFDCHLSSLPVHADAMALSRLFGNLLDNAMKYSVAGGHVTLRAVEQGADLIISVIDDGPGISELDCKQLFQLYRQGVEGRRHLGGSGIGLYFCKRVAEAHGGTIECRSQPGVETVFSVCLPKDARTVQLRSCG